MNNYFRLVIGIYVFSRETLRVVSGAAYSVLQLTACPWTNEASARERWQFWASNRKATGSNRDPTL